MPRSGIQSSQRSARTASARRGRPLDFNRFIGLSLAGAKTDKTCFVVLDYFPEHEKVFLSQIVDGLGPKKSIPADSLLVDKLKEFDQSVENIAVDVPTILPVCIKCRLRCPGYETCKVSEVVWMRDVHKNRSKSKKPNKMFTPYTERCAEIYLNNSLEEPFALSHALGANASPLMARALYLKKHFKYNLVEVSPKVSLWRMGRSMKIAKSHLRFHKHSTTGEESREVFLNKLGEKKIAFMYQQDIRTMIKKNVAFEAFISALTGYLQFRKQVEKRPKGYPKKAAWIDIPKSEISW